MSTGVLRVGRGGNPGCGAVVEPVCGGGGAVVKLTGGSGTVDNPGGAVVVEFARIDEGLN